MDEKAKAVINAMYFITNYPSDFIERCWADDPGMDGYFREKYNQFYEKHGSTAAPVIFFLYLGIGHQRKLAKWITENYSFELGNIGCYAKTNS